MTRYLMFISYLGTRFRGMQTSICKVNPGNGDVFSIQGILNITLRKLHPVKVPEVVISSRTDAGVHALRTAVHVDLEWSENEVYHPDRLLERINRYFDKSDIAIRVLECRVVPETLHVRYNAIKRSYLYRLAVRKADAPALDPDDRHSFQKRTLLAEYPLWEWRRCYFIQDPRFDEEQFRSAANLFVGEKDFRTFMSSVKDRIINGEKIEVNTVRNISSFDISHVESAVPSYISNSSSHYNYWDIVVCGKSFLYRQIRRMVGVLVAVALGKLHHSDVERMLAEPSPDSWKNGIEIAPAYGLYLLNVEYNPSDLKLENEKELCNSKCEKGFSDLEG